MTLAVGEALSPNKPIIKLRWGCNFGWAIQGSRESTVFPSPGISMYVHWCWQMMWLMFLLCSPTLRKTALHITSCSGKRDLTALLTASGADANIRDVQGQTPLWLAAQHGHQVRSLLYLLTDWQRDWLTDGLTEGLTLTDWQTHWLMPLWLAAQHGHQVRSLLYTCWTDTLTDWQTLMPLWLAAQHGHQVRSLLYLLTDWLTERWTDWHLLTDRHTDWCHSG